MIDSKDLYNGNDAFYTAYTDYLVEDRVRQVHDAVLAAVRPHAAFSRVMDLGCGKGNEFYHFAQPDFYLGIDQNADPRQEEKRNTIVADYRDFSKVESLAHQNDITGAISLFSVEITASATQNHAYYEELFRKAGIKAMLIGGFYYQHAKGAETVQEAGGLVSYQTHLSVDRPETVLFHETRIEIPCPSKLFGEDVMEVWRLLQHPDHYDPVVTEAFKNLVSEQSVTARAAQKPAISSKTPKPKNPGGMSC